MNGVNVDQSKNSIRSEQNIHVVTDELVYILIGKIEFTSTPLIQN